MKEWEGEDEGASLQLSVVGSFNPHEMNGNGSTTYCTGEKQL